MSHLSVKELKKSLVEAGFEVFRVRENEVHLAERQNIQLMEAGIRIRAARPFVLSIVVRAERNGSPSLSSDSQFSMIRSRCEDLIATGFVESQTNEREIRSVSDATQLLDVWYEVTFTRNVESIELLIEELRRALSRERCITATH